MGTPNLEKSAVQAFVEKHGSKASVGSFAEAAQYGELLVLCVAGRVAQLAVELAEPANFKGKTVIDTTNPISQEPAVNGVLKYFTKMNESLGEQIQLWLPDAHVVKAFSSAGNPFMTNGKQFGSEQPTMFICGNNAEAKKQVTKILDDFYWETLDCGMIEASRAIEPLAMLWCIPGFLYGQWNNAFKLMRK
jgi:predicted dinucleotide-binding enzyme